MLGGTGAYSAVTASRLGVQVGVVTRAASDLELTSLLPNIQIRHVPDTNTTTFENVYVDGERTQWIRKVTERLKLEDVPQGWRNARIVHLAPIAREVPLSMSAAFDAELLGATPQGWIRTWNDEGRVSYRPMTDPETMLAGIDALVFSPEDVAHDRNAVKRLAGAVPIAVVTRAGNGCDVYANGTVRPISARPVGEVVDPTGAGDVFAAAFFIRYRETCDPYEAARCANVAASFSIEGRGMSAIPTRAQVDAWMQQH